MSIYRNFQHVENYLFWSIFMLHLTQFLAKSHAMHNDSGLEIASGLKITCLRKIMNKPWTGHFKDMIH